MLDEEQRSMIMELYGKGVNISEIAKKVGVSRHSVYHVIHNDIEQDREIHKLKKQLRKTELQKRIWDLEMPMRKRIAHRERENVIDDLFSRILALWYLNPELGEKAGKRAPECLYCGEKLEYVERWKGERVVPGYRCNKCRKTFPFPLKKF